MCGIVGALVFNGSGFSVTEPYLVGMRDTMVHRGPDSTGAWVSEDGRVGLAHRRLSIIDLSEAAAQPMSNEGGTLWVSFNGEIYNHAEIRAELEQIGGHRWKTDHSDTEVILHAFEQWGIDCLDKFRGMFAIALWDAKARELWLVRDRIGIKPLYYSIHHGRITFASEIKALLQDPDRQRKVDEKSFYHYLTFLTSPSPHTLFEGICKLPGGSWLKIKPDGQIYERCYWDVWDHVNPLLGVSEEEIAERLLCELRESVRLRRVSDVPVGVFLSGGIDSSANLALFSEFEGRPVETFTIGYQGDYETYRNEMHYARMMAEKVGANYHQKVLTEQDLIDFLPLMIRLQDEPLADPVCFPLYFVSELARQHGVIVCQVGEGADELFCGYPTWSRDLRLARLNDLPVPRAVKKAGLIGLGYLGKQETAYYEWLRRTTLAQPLFWGGTDALNDAVKHRLLSPRLRERFANLTSWDVVRPVRERFEEKAWEKSHLHWMSYFDLNLRLPELMLMRVDKMTMGVGLEGRVPFLDHKFVELSMGIPEATKVKNGTLKYILKKAVQGIIPDEIIKRPKQGFHVPVYEWFFSRLGERIRIELEDFCRETDFFDPSEVRRFVREGRGTQVWYLFNFALWWKEYIGASAYAKSA